MCSEKVLVISVLPVLVLLVGFLILRMMKIAGVVKYLFLAGLLVATSYAIQIFFSISEIQGSVPKQYSQLYISIIPTSPIPFVTRPALVKNLYNNYSPNYIYGNKSVQNCKYIGKKETSWSTL